MASAAGQFQIARYASADGSLRLDELHVTGADGPHQGEQTVASLLANVDEATFNHVFAVSLSEMQELATLSDTQAAEVLYSITAGLDRVSLIEVMRELEASRARIIDPGYPRAGGGACQVAQLTHQRDQIARQIEELQSQMHAYARLLGDRDVIQRELAQLDEAKKGLQEKFDVYELALLIRERRRRRRALDEELAGLGPGNGVPADALQRLDALRQRAAKHEASLERLHHHRQKLRREAAELDVNEALGRCGPRIAATLEQDPWFRSLEGQITELEKHHNDLHATMFAEYEKMGLGTPERRDRLPTLSPQALTRLRQPGKRLGEALRDFRDRRSNAEDAHHAAAGVHKQVTEALADRDAPDLTTATERAGNLVNQLRRRIQLDERLEQLARNQQELREQSHGLLPAASADGEHGGRSGGDFCGGRSVGGAGHFHTRMEHAHVLAALRDRRGDRHRRVLARYAALRSNDQQLEQSQNQLRLLEMQIKQSQDERAVLDDQLPDPQAGTPAGRWLPGWRRPRRNWRSWRDWRRWIRGTRPRGRMPTRRAAAQDQADEELRGAAGVAQGLEKAGLPPDFKPRQVRLAARLAVRIQDMQARWPCWTTS